MRGLSHTPEGAIAIIGMACRFPSSPNIGRFWDTLVSGQEAIQRRSLAELLAGGADPARVGHHDFVRSFGVLEGIDLFDAAFFGMSPREAEITDPQQRLFLECASMALEDAAVSSHNRPERVGVFGGVGWTSYLLLNLATQKGLLSSDAGHQVILGNDKDNLATRVSYKLNLTGPSVTVQTGCSTSLVAVGLACQSLLEYQSDLALAGGASVLPLQQGYRYFPGGILSPDGRCRAFDADANGTVLGSGAGVVTLRRLEDALAAGDPIHAVIRSVAVNNDGGIKPGYTAPSSEGQARVIREALALAGLSSDAISYVEAHGTGTHLGDPIELAGLARAFNDRSLAAGPCAIGSVKSVIGHLDAAAGIAGLIKTVLALKHRTIPPTLHLRMQNPLFDWAASPFFANAEVMAWESADTRRAGVSSFGLGGTNAHAIIEEAPDLTPSTAEDTTPYLLILSAKTDTALGANAGRLADHLRSEQTTRLADVAATLATGRDFFDCRGFVVAGTAAQAVERLHLLEATPSRAARAQAQARPVAFLFSGQGIQRAGTVRCLAASFPTVRAVVDTCLDRLLARVGLDLRPLLFSEAADSPASAALREPRYAQPALFILEYALAQQWIAWGIIPRAVLGHSLGEIAAAATAGVLTLDDALVLVGHRGRLMQDIQDGAMLAIALPEGDVHPWLGPDFDLAAVNAPDQCVISGPAAAIAALHRSLDACGIPASELATSVAFHSRAMDPILDDFGAVTKSIRMAPPTLPFISTLTGTWVPPSATPALDHWERHVREPVRFAAALQTLSASDIFDLIEIGPGRALCGLVARQLDRDREVIAVPSLPDPKDDQADVESVLHALGRVWEAGGTPDWSAVLGGRGHRVHLPTYAFDRQSYFVHPSKPEEPSGGPLGRADVWRVLAEQLCDAGGQPSADDRDPINTLSGDVEALSRTYVEAAATRLGLPIDASLEEVGRAGVIPRYSQLAAELISSSVLALHKKNGEPPVDIEAVRAAHPDEATLLDLLSACGSSLTEVLTGNLDARSLFDSVLAQDRTRTGEADRLRTRYAARLRDGFSALVRTLPLGTRLRILEIGGGTGIATSAILPTLPKDLALYTFSDLSPFFLDRARREFQAYPFVDYRILDINTAPFDQGFAPASYDIVIAVNVLHIADCIDEALTRVHSLLARGGLAVIWETTTPSLEFSVTYGLLMGPVHDGRRTQANPFLSPGDWKSTLAAAGFGPIRISEDHPSLSESLFVAQAKDSAELSTGAAPAFEPVEKTGITALLRKEAVADWLYSPSWRRLPLSARRAAQPIITNCWLIFVDSLGLGARLSDLLRASGCYTVLVSRGTSFAETPEGDFTVRPTMMGDYLALFDRLEERGYSPWHLVHLWSVQAGSEPPPGEVDGNLRAILELIKALGSVDRRLLIDLTLVTVAVHDVIGDEIVRPHDGFILAVARVVPLEFPDLQCRAIDLPRPANNDWPAELVSRIASDVDGAAPDRIVAYRGAYRWVPTVEAVRTVAPDKARDRLRRNGVYLVTGGCGMIGLAIAEHIADIIPARFVLTRRSAVPTRTAWPTIANPAEQKLFARLRAIEAAGSHVEIVQADVADIDEMRQLVNRVQSEHGQIVGVIHSAGVLGDGAIHQKSAHALAEVLRPKVQGTLVLEQLFAGAGLDFFVLFSSLSAIKPGFGQVAYAAANNFVEAFARKSHNRTDLPVTCISWDVWRGDGMAFDAAAPAALQALKEADIAHRGITAAEGIEAFDRLLASRLPHALVCTTNYLTDDGFDLNKLYIGKLDATRSFGTRHRPELAVPFAPAGSPTEARLAAIWSRLLGIENIGVNDNFFELGGDSLIGMQVLADLRREFGVAMKTKDIFAYPTISAFAHAVEDDLLRRLSPESLGRLLVAVNAEE
ncbi:SDR family NAD(P)-dependent oxidoreductase [Bradyrhizobium sp. 156]|uniref:type I polyketide synthase n=1 Tax=Bradyrhizobium sp. 156 TaxID=2782630 RepID=UPI001FF8D239|nr:type I polyketide synthase [Bradyrhizobium sp. 156]MCK1326628.1 SDR family NAD(P)-dependent oxidoreductase [Bradyrhizobium sp. 156]